MDRKCPKCSSEMEVGYLLDRSQASYQPLQWIAGEPEFGLFGSVKYQGKPWAPTESWICKRCGYLEMYARLKKEEG